MTVVDDPTANRFELRDGEHLAELGYRAEDDRLVLLHTEVPDELGGQGIGGQLVRAAVERAERTGEQIAPWCPFTRSWLEKHPDEAARVTIDWSPAPDE
jgi:predicted GNAT family acetyltransferase